MTVTWTFFWADFHDIRRGLHELVGELADVDEAVLKHADVDECAEGGDVRHNAEAFSCRP